MKFLTPSIIFRVIAAGMLIWALFNRNIDYYLFLRWAVCLASAYVIYVAWATKRLGWAVPFIALIALFNPFIYPNLMKETWMQVDIVAAIVVLVSVFFVRESADA